jgi:ferredoxin
MNLSPQFRVPEANTPLRFKIHPRAAAGLGVGIFIGVLALGWMLRLQSPGAWLGLLFWSAVSGWTVFEILKKGRFNPYRLRFFSLLALGTLAAVLLAQPVVILDQPLPAAGVREINTSQCHIALAAMLLNLLANAGIALTGLEPLSGISFYLAAFGLLAFTLLLGTAWCSWACGYGAWDECISRLGRRHPRWEFAEPKGIWKYLNFGVWLSVLLLAWLQGEAIFCQWVCPFKVTENVAGTAGLTQGLHIAYVAVLGIGLIVVLPFLTGRRIFCRYVCPFGAWQSLVGKINPFQKQCDASRCSQCAHCRSVCAMQAITLQTDKVVFERACNHCGRCEDECPNGAVWTQWGKPQPGSGIEPRRWMRVFFVMTLGLVAGTVGASVWIKTGQCLWLVFVR